MKRRIWIITDTHFEHDMMVEALHRPVHHTLMICDNLLNNVKHSDMLIHLGDIAFRNDEVWNRKLSGLTDKCILIRGNHDNRNFNWYLDKGWNAVMDQMYLEFYSKRILFSHIPQPDNGTFDINIHGHFHNNEHRSREPEYQNRMTDKHILLALENHNYMPWNLESIYKKGWKA